MRLPSFDYTAFKIAFRDAAVRRAIDPQTGATSYQAALIAADARKARLIDRAWWQSPCLWVNSDPRDSTESCAIANVVSQAARATLAKMTVQQE